jgi:hypothetical protein
MNTRLAVDVEEPAAMFGCLRDFYGDHIRYEHRTVRRGRMVLIPVAELSRWVDQNAARVV